jgi:hypothetical protein
MYPDNQNRIITETVFWNRETGICYNLVHKAIGYAYEITDVRNKKIVVHWPYILN